MIPVKIQVNRTSLDRTSDRSIFLTTNWFYCDKIPNGFDSWIKSCGWSYFNLKKLHLKFQIILTSFDPVMAFGDKSAFAWKVFGFPTNLETLLLVLHAFPSTLLQAKHAEKMSKNFIKICQKEKKSKNSEKRSKWGPKTSWSLATIGAWLSVAMEVRVHQTSTKTFFFCVLFSFSCHFAYKTFRKSNFWGMTSINLHQHHGFFIEPMDPSSNT